MKKLGIAVIAMGVFAAPASASAPYLHVREARLVNKQLAIQITHKTRDDDTYRLGGCVRRSRTRVNCTFYLDWRQHGTNVETRYLSRVYKTTRTLGGRTTPQETYDR